MSHKTCSEKCNRWPKPILLEGFCFLKIMVFPAVLFHVHELFPGYDNDWNHLFSIVLLVTARKLACNNTILSMYMYFPVLHFNIWIIGHNAIRGHDPRFLILCAWQRHYGKCIELWGRSDSSTPNVGSWNYVW